MSEKNEEKPVRKFGIILSIIPLFLIVSVCVALYLGANEETPEQVPVEGEVTLSEMQDYLNKLTHLVGKRDLESKEGQQGLRSVSAMIDGTLSPANIGYEIFQKNDPAEGLLWRTLWVEIGPKDDDKASVLLIPYGKSGAEVAFSLGLAEYFTKHKPQGKLKLVFYPPVPGFTSQSLASKVLSEGEDVKSVVHLSAKSGGLEWANVSILSSGNERSRIQDLLEKHSWGKAVNLDDSRAAFPLPGGDFSISLTFNEGDDSKSRAEKFLRMLPVVKILIDQIGG